MTIYQVTCNVQPGSIEFFKDISLGNNDIIEFYFDSEATIDDIIADGTSLNGCKLELVYPASDTVLGIASSIVGDFYLNTASSTANLWYRVPAKTKLVFTAGSSGNSGDFKICVIARAG